MLTDRRVTVAVAAVFVVALVVALWAPIEPQTKAELVGTIGTIGVVLAGLLRGAK
jgi:hypothetical protein